MSERPRNSREAPLIVGVVLASCLAMLVAFNAFRNCTGGLARDLSGERVSGELGSQTDTWLRPLYDRFHSAAAVPPEYDPDDPRERLRGDAGSALMAPLTPAPYFGAMTDSRTNGLVYRLGQQQTESGRLPAPVFSNASECCDSLFRRYVGIIGTLYGQRQDPGSGTTACAEFFRRLRYVLYVSPRRDQAYLVDFGSDRLLRVVSLAQAGTCNQGQIDFTVLSGNDMQARLRLAVPEAFLDPAAIGAEGSNPEGVLSSFRCSP